MADGMIQKTEDGGQRTEACVPLRGTFIQGAATPRQHLCLLSSVLCPLNAEELTDPTRPPLSITAPTVAGSAEMPPPAGLRSIIISKTRRAAIIDGETVELGGKHGDARLVEVNEAGVVLKGAQGMQVLTLFPDVKMIGRKEMKARQQPAASKVQTGNKPAVRKENE